MAGNPQSPGSGKSKRPRYLGEMDLRRHIAQQQRDYWKAVLRHFSNIVGHEKYFPALLHRIDAWQLVIDDLEGRVVRVPDE